MNGEASFGFTKLRPATSTFLNRSFMYSRADDSDDENDDTPSPHHNSANTFQDIERNNFPAASSRSSHKQDSSNSFLPESEDGESSVRSSVRTGSLAPWQRTLSAPSGVHSHSTDSFGEYQSALENQKPLMTGGQLADEELDKFHRTLQFLALDSSQRRGGFISAFLGMFLIAVVPLLAFYWMEPLDKMPEHQLPFRLLVLSLQSLLATVAFFFIHSTMRKYGLRGVLLLDEASEESFEIQMEYSRCLHRANPLLLRLFAPAFLLHAVQKVWLFCQVPLRVIPFALPEAYKLPLTIAFALTTSVAWMFQTTTFLFVCVIFWKVCTLQVLKMMSYREAVRHCVSPSFCFKEYSRIVSGLAMISRRFRLFLALTGGVTLLGGLASMYQMVLYRESHLNFVNSGNVAVVNWVALMGTGLCLRSASKLAHLHRRIIKVASTMHAHQTYDAYQYAHSATPGPAPPGAEVSVEALHALSLRQEAWAQRAALVTYLSNTSAGISVYGFVLDRSFVHTTLGALLTTTWFILGRSLSGSLPTLTNLFLT